MKTPDFLNTLPSVNELLDDPRVRSVADRLSQSVVATRVRGYLDRVAAEAKRRAAGAETALGEAMPGSMRELIDRVSQVLTHGDGELAGVAINATGRFRGGPWLSAPLSDAAAERLLASSAGFTASPSGQQDGGQSGAEHALRRTTGAEAAAVFNSHTAAFWAALASLGGEDAERRGVVVARRDLVTLDGGCRVSDLIERTGLRAKEIGAADGATLDDYAAAVNNETAAILLVAGDDAWPAGPNRVATSDLAQLAHRHGAVLIEHAGGAPLVELPSGEGPATAAADALSAEPIAAVLAAGADLVVAAGDGLIGGPACGVAVGKAEAVRRLKTTPIAAVSTIEPRIASALAATIDQLLDADRFWSSVPVWSLLTTPLDNLQTRADRVAALVGAAMAGSVEVAPLSALEAPPTGLPIRLPTITLAIGTAAGVDEDRLRRGEPSVQATTGADGRLRIDLRTVFPRQDGELIDALCRSGAAI